MPSEGGAPEAPDLQPGGAQPVGLDARRHRRSSSAPTFENVRPAATRSSTPSASTDGARSACPLDRGVLMQLHRPTARSSLYSRRGNEEYYWKRYKGGQYHGHLALRLRSQDLHAGHRLRRQERLPDVDRRPMYFVSDRGESGIANLYAQDLGDEAGRPGHDVRRLRRA
ncbi:MAG: hypothetical protein MZW92_60520 [Comamonadaceae bacterium]|nr:hypothetical protein [Comamonadaceae bacterium]